ncbi:hypothetical protein HGP28_13225 [Vibrio sp. SM6]|uniref:Integral membrane protein n=1 Tax=Vibrio agarilyticus TaxID=2726741 RepID=A0A7X8YHZ0_9VIBR|nr:hypothetical protein [Vibrio agarilyticus]NLS13852.1 hypothetical protein [Vibrio agarilyticus]
MLFSTLQFIVALLLVMFCARFGADFSEQFHWAAFAIPVLWLWPVTQLRAMIFALALVAFGWTLSYQPFSLSVAIWMLCPMFSVVSSKRSNWGVLATVGVIAVTLLASLFVTQEAGKLAGLPWVTVTQALLVGVIWWALRDWKMQSQPQWPALLLLVPLWISGDTIAVLMALSLVALLLVGQALHARQDFDWDNLLAWSLPAVSFAALELTQAIEVPKPVFVIWLCLLGTAWMADYVLRTTEECEDDDW